MSHTYMKESLAVDRAGGKLWHIYGLQSQSIFIFIHLASWLGNLWALLSRPRKGEVVVVYDYRTSLWNTWENKCLDPKSETTERRIRMGEKDGLQRQHDTFVALRSNVMDFISRNIQWLKIGSWGTVELPQPVLVTTQIKGTSCKK